MSPFKTINVNCFPMYGNVHLFTVSQPALDGEIIDERGRLRIEMGFGVLFAQKGMCTLVHTENDSYIILFENIADHRLVFPFLMIVVK